VAVIEWFDRFPRLWDGDRLEIEMGFEDSGRNFSAKGFGSRWASVVEGWRGGN
jgi:tRNA A37 threonylcarbamoyladenosine biosynthesis protein TsaE